MRLACVNYNFDVVCVRMCCIVAILRFSNAIFPPRAYFVMCQCFVLVFFPNRKQNKLNKYIEGQKQKFTQLDLQDVEVREKNKDCKSKGKKLHKQLEKDKEKVCCSLQSPPRYTRTSHGACLSWYRRVPRSNLRLRDRDTDQRRTSTSQASVGCSKVCPFFILMTRIREKCKSARGSGRVGVTSQCPALVLSRGQSTNVAQKLQ